MNRKEAINYLLDNPHKKIRMVKDEYGNSIKHSHNIIAIKNSYIVYIHNNYDLELFLENDLSEFEPVRDLKKMAFGEAYHYVKSNKISTYKMKSYITCKDFTRFRSEILKEEYMGLWTIEGVYEDES